MELRQLKYFLAVSEEGQITKAAERLHITQPPLSQQIILLEQDLGVQLFNRTKKHIRLTEAGQILQQRAKQIIELLKTTRDEVQDSSNGVRGKLTIGMITSSGRFLIPEQIQEFHRTYPLISYDLRQGDTQRILELLNSHLIEIGFVLLPVDTSLYNFVALPNEGMIMVAAPHFLVSDNDKELTLNKLKDQPWLIHRRYETIIYDYCHQLGFEPNILCISDEVAPLLLYAQLKIGIALVPESAINLLPSSSLLVRKIIKPSVPTTSGLIWLKNHALSTAATNFIEIFRQRLVTSNPKTN
ncbi:LysR family transcriptional regulator [Sporomusa aerivorans]|uniref:LysR family transcriptional regulator n=1 Tax=Sporomusa aerivorans TaxID=204936 RepID=UPI00352A9801